MRSDTSVRAERRTWRANLAGLGCQAFLAGFWGEDGEKRELAALLEKAGVDTVGVVTGTLPTISKTRIVGRRQQLLRLDIESRETIPAVEMERLTERAVELAGKVHAVILSDYAKGRVDRGALCAGDSRGTGGGGAGVGRSEDTGLRQVQQGDDGVPEPERTGGGYGHSGA